MQKLNRNEEAVLEYIREAVRQNRFAPSVRDIAQGLGYKSTSTVQMYLDRLEQYGYIKRENGKSRSITLCHTVEHGIPIVRIAENGRTDTEASECLPFEYCGNIASTDGLTAYLLESGSYAIVQESMDLPAFGVTVAVRNDEGVCLQDVNDIRSAELLGKVLAVIKLY